MAIKVMMQLKRFRHLLFLPILWLFTQAGLCQDVDKKYIDSILTSTSNQDYSELYETFTAMTRSVVTKSKEEGVALFEYGLSKDLSKTYRMLLLRGYGSFLTAKNSHDYALPYNLEGLDLSKELGYEQSQITFSIHLAYTYLYQNLPDRALFYLNEVEPIALKLNNKESLISTSYVKASVYEAMEDHTQSTFYYKKAWGILNSIDDHPERGFYLYILVDYFTRIGDHAELAKFTEEYTLYKQKKNPDAPIGHLPIDGVFDKSATPENIAKYKEVIRLSDSLGTINAKVYSALALAEIYAKLNKHDEGIAYLKLLENQLDTLKRQQQLMIVYRGLSGASAANNNHEDALKYRNLESALRDSVVSVRMKNNIAELEVKYDTQTKERELEKKAASQKLLYWILGFVGAILLLISVFLFRNSRKNRQLAKQKKLLEKTVGEKNILLRETHHRVKNSFQMVSSLLYLQSENVEDEEAKLAIKEAQNRVRSMVLIHHKLYSKDQLVGIDSKEYMQDLTKDIFESHQSQTQDIAYTCSIESLVLSVDTITPIGLILNELIINALKHAFTASTSENHLLIEFKQEEDTLVLKVIDNGIGFGETDKEYSFGLKLIKALARKLEASFDISSEIGKGTSSILTIKEFEILT